MKKKDPSFAILLATHNGGKWVSEQLDSIFAQTSSVFTIFISDDNSSDETIDIINKYKKIHKNIKIINTKKKFGSAALNFYHLLMNVDFSNFDYISFADQDDIWVNDKLISAHEILSKRNYQAYSANVISFDSYKDIDNLTLRSHSNNEAEEYFLADEINKAQQQKLWDHYFECPGPGLTFIFKKNVAKSLVKFIKKNYYEVSKFYLHDWLVYNFIRSSGFNWYIDSYYCAYYRQHQSNVLGSNRTILDLVWRLKYIYNNKWFNQINILLKLKSKINPKSKKPSFPIKEFGSRGSFLKLMTIVFKCRRRLKDVFLLFALTLFFVIKNK